MINLVQLMSFVTDNGQKFAVHCHAGYGRTGLAIACYLLYSSEMSAEQAISLVRSKRPKCIETKTQVKFVKKFHNYLTRIRILYPEKPISLPEFLANQSVLLHGNQEKQLNGLPKIVYLITSLIRERSDQGMYTKSQVALSFYNPNHSSFSSLMFMAFLKSTQDVAASIDETYITPNSENPSELIEQKIRTYKHQLNSYNFVDLKVEKDIRVLSFLLLD